MLSFLSLLAEPKLKKTRLIVLFCFLQKQKRLSLPRLLARILASPIKQINVIILFCLPLIENVFFQLGWCNLTSSLFRALRNILYCCYYCVSYPCFSVSVAVHSFKSATDLCLGSLLHYQLTNPCLAPLTAI